MQCVCSDFHLLLQGGPRVPLGPWPNVPTPNEAQGVDLSGVRAPRPLMSLGTEHSQQMQKGQSLKQPIPLMRPGQPVSSKNYIAHFRLVS